jgi:hypothetical protein
VTAVLNPFNDAAPGIAGAGVANQGTRLALQVNTTTLPTGTTSNPFVVLVPEIIPLTVGGNVSGVAVLTSTDANGAGPYTPPTSIPAVPASVFAAGQTFGVVPTTGLVVYEVLFADPFAIESAAVPVVVAYNATLSSNAPTPNLTTTGTGSFAPFYTTAAAGLASGTLPIPRFTPSLSSAGNLFTVVKCACDMLFPFVASGGGFDTGIAIANTSLDPGPAGSFTPGASPQSGSVTFWYYGQGTNAPQPAAPPSQTTSGVIPPGGSLLYVLSSGGGGITSNGGGTVTSSGLDGRAANFTGYIIAQAQFQYCHAFAFIGALGAGPASPGISEGYLALILDTGGINRSVSLSETLNN